MHRRTFIAANASRNLRPNFAMRWDGAGDECFLSLVGGVSGGGEGEEVCELSAVKENKK